MKRKFSFNLTPSKTSSKSDKALREAIADHGPPPSPFINRRMLDFKTEAELRASCAIVLQGSRPAGFEDEPPGQTFNLDATERSTAVRVAENYTAPQDHISQAHTYWPNATTDPSRYAYKPGKPLKDIFSDSYVTNPAVLANISRRRDVPDSRSQPTKPQAYSDRPRTAQGADSDNESYSTPLTGTSERYNNASTSFTSAAITPARKSRRPSEHSYRDQSVTSHADAAAPEWTRLGYERGRQSEEQERRRPVSRASSKARSITSNIRDYIRPNSALSRSSSRDSIRSRSSAKDTGRSPSSGGWRSWTLHRNTSNSSISSQGTGEKDRKGREKRKPEINLNRELPPLPSLDNWEQQKPATNTHIAALMRPRAGAATLQPPPTQRQVSQPLPSLTKEQKRISHRKTLSDDINISSGRSSRPLSGLHIQPAADSERSSRGPDMAQAVQDIDDLMSAMGRTRSVERARSRRYDSGLTQDSGSGPASLTFAQSTGRRESVNFSRKISTDTGGRSYDASYPRLVEISSADSNRLREKKSTGFRKVINAFVSGNKKKEKPMTWMDRIEREGVKGGIMYHDEAAGAPIVRY
ncbi:hypothetical protein H2201_002868 [Coniosporium apollinis]|uniref:Uncharacterized protein n=1 Tax=Coniosporium apollinis TaxID=61459 RepID=A0ABQ9NXB9_9PEZI|nr:hypothetical protein H2201_002868 [Coniosporium apollinis]